MNKETLESVLRYNKRAEEEINRQRKEIERLKNNWTSLKNFITDNCFYDTDTITFEELESKIMELEN